MAGKNIYIEKILDNLLSGVDTALNAVKEAMQKMIGGDDPETQKSLPDVVNKLDDVIGEDGKSLSNVVTALQDNAAVIIGSGDKSLTDVTTELLQIADLINAQAAGIFVKEGNSNTVNLFYDGSTQLPSGTLNINKVLFYANCTGIVTLNFSFYYRQTSSGSSLNINLYKNNDTDAFYSYTVSGNALKDETIAKKIQLKPGDFIVLKITGNRSETGTARDVYIRTNQLAFDIGASPATPTTAIIVNE